MVSRMVSAVPTFVPVRRENNYSHVTRGDSLSGMWGDTRGTLAPFLVAPSPVGPCGSQREMVSNMVSAVMSDDVNVSGAALPSGASPLGASGGG